MYMETNLNHQELTLFTAQKAHERSKSIITDTSKEQLCTVLNKILKKSDNGEFFCYYYETLHPNVVTELKSRGFEITSISDPRDGTTYTIKW